MKRAFIGLAGLIVGGILLVPSVLLREVFSGQQALAGNPLILAFQAIGIALIVGAPLLYWIILPAMEHRQREKGRH